MEYNNNTSTILCSGQLIQFHFSGCSQQRLPFQKPPTKITHRRPTKTPRFKRKIRKNQFASSVYKWPNTNWHRDPKSTVKNFCTSKFSSMFGAEIITSDGKLSQFLTGSLILFSLGNFTLILEKPSVRHRNFFLSLLIQKVAAFPKVTHDAPQNVWEPFSNFQRPCSYNRDCQHPNYSPVQRNGCWRSGVLPG